MTTTPQDQRFALLEGYLAHDPDNTALLGDAAAAALAANRAEAALVLFDRLACLRPLERDEANQRAVAAMRAGQPEAAAQAFAHLLADAPEDCALSFNHAWALALAGRMEDAAAALTPEAVETLPQAAMLEVQLAHQAGRFEEAADLARQARERHPGYAPLDAATAVLAMDMDDEVLAREAAEAAGDHPDAWTTLGLLHLGDSDTGKARELLERALAVQPHAPRAVIGLGLAEMVAGNLGAAGPQLDRGAQMLGDHLGSWIAAGWSYLLAGDADTARARFEHARELDDTFAEIHGSLAVIDVMDGAADQARRGIETALRLDRQCFSAAFANMLLTAADGDADKAARILQVALAQPLGPSGRTLADAIARVAR